MQFSVLSFEDRVLEGLSSCDVREFSYTTIIAAVSGGADSVALLTALAKLSSDGRLGAQVSALTIDHGIRAAEESEGDALFVRDYCARLGVMCKTERFPPGEAVGVAKERGMGVEEAARFLRYKAFGRALDETPASILCAAHTRDDNLETILMRFFQGSASSPLAGIPALRRRIARPMLHITRREVLDYLEARGIAFRHDRTNDDTAFLRNNIRLNLIPALDEYFPGWKTALEKGAEKSRDDAEVVREGAQKIAWQNDGDSLRLPSDTFFCAPRAVRRELIYAAWDTLSGAQGGRLPYKTVSRVCDGFFPARSGGISFEKTERSVVVKKTGIPRGEEGFFMPIEQAGRYEAGGWIFGAGDSGVCAELPVCIRSPLPTDAIAFGSAGKPLAKLFSEAKIPARERARIPVVESRGEIAAAFGSALGKRDWISARSKRLADGRANSAENPTPDFPPTICIKFEGAAHDR
jgi:tRNA(Ile)-lysidine synthase